LNIKKSYTRNYKRSKATSRLSKKQEDQKKKTGTKEMSWMSKKTGRPKEQGGHRRINISVDKPTRDVLQRAENKSKFIEHVIHAWKHPMRIRFFQPKETLNDDQYKFKDAAIFTWTPNNSTDNAILSLSCCFQYRCGGKGLRFRITINEATTSTIGGLTSIHYTSSYVYADHDFHEGIKTFPNQSNYTIKFQFAPQSSLDEAYVKDISIFLEVVDGLPALSS